MALKKLKIGQRVVVTFDRPRLPKDDPHEIDGTIAHIGLSLVQVHVPFKEGLVALSLEKDSLLPGQLPNEWEVILTHQEAA